MVLLVSFLDVPGWSTWSENGLEVIDLFSGKARISRLASWLGYKSRAFDMAYHPVRYPQRRKRGKLPRGCMDINGSAGFANLNPKKVNMFFAYCFSFQKFEYRNLCNLLCYPKLSSDLFLHKLSFFGGTGSPSRSQVGDFIVFSRGIWKGTMCYWSSLFNLEHSQYSYESKRPTHSVW